METFTPVISDPSHRHLHSAAAWFIFVSQANTKTSGQRRVPCKDQSPGTGLQPPEQSLSTWAGMLITVFNYKSAQTSNLQTELKWNRLGAPEPSQLLITMTTRPDNTHTHTHTRLMALCPGPPGWAGTNLDFTEAKRQWVAVESAGPYAKSAPRSRQITMPAPHHSVFYRPDAQPTVSQH